jgi:hypothetical protein
MAKSIQRSFAGGEITPEMYGRIDLTKFQTGLALCQNFLTLPHGPAARRPGGYFVNQCRYAYTPGTSRPVKLRPFIFSAGQAYVLEFGDSYVRMHSAAGTELEAAKAITSLTLANPGVFNIAAHGYSVGDWLFVDQLPTSTLSARVSGRFFIVDTVPDVDHFTLRAPPSYGAGAGTALSTAGLDAFSGGQVRRVYTLAAPYLGTDILNYAQSNDVMTLTSTAYQTRELRRLGSANWQFASVSFAITLAAPTGPGAVATIPTATNPTTQSYVVTAVGADLVTESVASAVATCSNNLTLAGNFNTISWSSVVGASRYYVYRLRGGTYGFIGQTEGLSLVDDNITPDVVTTPPTSSIVLNTGAGDYPAAVTYYERRRWFGGTGLKPQNFWFTRSGTENNLSSSIPGQSDDALELRIASQQQQNIRHLVALQDVVALTASGEHRIFADGGPVISLETLSIKPQGATGANLVQPALANDRALYVQAQGSYIRELAFDPSGLGRFTSENVSIMAPHLFDGFTITDLAYCRAPVPVLWALRSDGVLLGMTHMPEQQVYGWHRHVSGGHDATDTPFIESICSIPENNEDVLYMAVRRQLGGGYYSVNIERLTTRHFIDQSDAFFVDCGLTYSGAPVSRISGLWHLEGLEVDIAADGAVMPRQTVSGGGITLDSPASTVHVGLNYVSDLMTLPMSYEGAPASGQGTMKNVSKVFLRVKASSIAKAGPRFDKLREYPAREVSDPYGAPPALRTAELGITLDPSWTTDGSICVRQDQPLPLTVCAISHETATGGG